MAKYWQHEKPMSRTAGHNVSYTTRKARYEPEHPARSWYRPATYRAYAAHIEACEAHGIAPHEMTHWCNEFEKLPESAEEPASPEPMKWPSPLTWG